MPLREKQYVDIAPLEDGKSSMIFTSQDTNTVESYRVGGNIGYHPTKSRNINQTFLVSNHGNKNFTHQKNTPTE